MFTGIIEEVGTVKSITMTSKTAQIQIGAKNIIQGIHLGDSVATNGVCLTVTTFDTSTFTVDVMAETFRDTALKHLKNSSKVNLERALLPTTRMGGHFVSGHVDGVGIIGLVEKEENAHWYQIHCDPEILKYIIKKGSVALDGISLTVQYVDEKSFKVSIIPHTSAYTTLMDKKTGDAVNIECDILGKYIEKFLLGSAPTPKKEINMSFLAENGFLS